MVNPVYRIQRNNAPLHDRKDFNLIDQGFFSDVADEFMLSWIGQLYQNNFVLDQKIYKEKPPDPIYDPMKDIEGFEEFADVFMNVRNKDHADFLKEKIIMNNARRTRLDASDRVWGPALTSLLADPLTYVPIPLAKGVGFFSRALKGGAIGSGLVGSTEIIRRKEDPTSTNAETGMILAGSFLMSGLFSGALGRRIGDTSTPKISKYLYDKMKESKYFSSLPNKILKTQHEFNGHHPFEETGFVWTLSTGATRTTKVIEDTKFALLKKNKGFRQIPVDDHARYDIKNDIMYLNEGKVLDDYNNGIAIIGGPKGNILARDTFAHPNDYKKFVMQVAINKAVYEPWNLFKKKNPNATKLDWEQTVRGNVYEEFQLRRTQGGDDLNKFNVLSHTWRKWTSNVVRATGKIKDNDWYSKVLEGFGDYGISQNHNAHGVTTPPSALVESIRRFRQETSALRNFIDLQYMLKSGLDTELVNNTTGINTEIKFKQLTEFSRQDQFQFETDVFLASGSNTVLERSDEFVQAAAKAVRVHLQKQNKINEELQLYDTPENYLAKSNKMMAVYERLEKEVATVTNPELKAALEENLTALDNKIKTLFFSLKAEGSDGVKREWVQKTIYTTPKTSAKIVVGNTKRNTNGRYVPAYFSKKDKTIYIDKDYIETVMFNEKAWSKPKIKGVTPFPENEFKTPEEWYNFVLTHEILHTTVPNTKKLSKVDYENQINRLAREQNKRAGKSTKWEIASEEYMLKAENYIPLYQDFGKIAKDPKQFKEDWFNFLSTTTMRSDNPEFVRLRVDSIYDAVMRTKEMGEDANLLMIMNNAQEAAALGADISKFEVDQGVLRLGSSNFMKRSFDIDYDALPDSPVMKYYQTNVKDVITRYSNVNIKVQEMARVYGDPFAELFQIEEYHRLLMKHGKTKQGRANVRESLQKFNDLMERHYMVFNASDPTSWTKQTVEALKDYTSLVAMGGALVSNLTELARPTMVHGFEKAFPLYKAWLTQNMGLFRKVLKQVHLENGEPIEVALGAMNRFLQDMGYTGNSGKLGKGYDALTAGLKDLQVPFYWVNGLTPWTIFWKNMSSAISSHGIILDAIKLTTAKNPITKKAVSNRETNAITARLAQYGIDKKTAELITRMPYSKEGNLFLANAPKWDTIPGGKIAREKFRLAMQAQQDNTIITPMITDTPNIIGGAITITSDEAKAIFKNPLLNRIVKPIKTPYGYKINMTWGSLPFQFMPWAFAATNKMVINGFQAMKYGDRQVAANITAMIALGGMVAYLKNPYGVQNMSNTELALEAVDRSGVLGIIPDINYTIETVSEGLTGNMIGGRPVIGALLDQELGPRYGKQDFGDAVGEVFGPGPSIPIDIIRILTGSYDYNTKHDMIRLMLPFQNLIGIEKLLKPMYSKAIEETIG